MDEQKFIYGKLKQLQDQVAFLTDIVERQGEMFSSVTAVLEKMQSPEYASKLAKTAQMVELEEKLNMIRGLNKKRRS